MYIGTKIQLFEKVDSTNDFLRENASQYPDGSIVVAKLQNKGRGRFTRKWISDVKGNLYCSILVKDATWFSTPTHLPIFMAVVLRRTIITIAGKDNPALGFKWPNDLVSDGAKLSGILVEAGRDFFVIGIGVNVNKAPILDSSCKTTSMNDLFPMYKEIEPLVFVDFMKNCYNEGVKQYSLSGFGVFKQEWERYCVHMNKKVDLNEGIDDNTRKQTVLFKRLNDDGGAVVIGESKEERVVYYGELS